MEPRSDDLLYPLVRRYVHETAWAVLPSVLDTIVEVVTLRAHGGRFTAEEITERIDAAGGRRDATASTGTGMGVAVIPVAGVIAPKASGMQAMSGGWSLQTFNAHLDAAMADRAVDRIVLNIDSPGGSVDLIPETAARIREASRSKPVTAVANTLAASAAYWLASAADEIVVTPSGLVGSIGVLVAHDDVSGYQEQRGVKTTLVSAGRFKTDGSPYAPITDTHRDHLQGMVDDFYSMFVHDVAEGRGVTTKTVIHEMGEGRVVTAQKAVRLGMADRVATLDETLSRLVGSDTTAGVIAGGDQDAPSDEESDAVVAAAIDAVADVVNNQSLKEAHRS